VRDCYFFGQCKKVKINGDKRYELSNHLGNVLSVITDQKLLNIDRGIPVLDARFDQSNDISPFHPTSKLVVSVREFKHKLAVNCDKKGEGVYTTLSLQEGHGYLIKYEIGKNEPIIQVSIKDKEGQPIYEVLLEESGNYHRQFEVNATGTYTLTFANYEESDEMAEYLLDNIEVIDITGLKVDYVLENSDNMAIFVPSVLSFNDYYPYGMLMPNRHANSSLYRYGFQGQELDNEIKGEGNSLNYKFRMHDPRVGRFFAVDPLTAKYPWYTPYQFSGNKVINSVELEGKEEEIAIFNGSNWIYLKQTDFKNWSSDIRIAFYEKLHNEFNGDGNIFFYGHNEYFNQKRGITPQRGLLRLDYTQNPPVVCYEKGNLHIPPNSDGVILEGILRYNPFGPFTHSLFSDEELDYRDQQFENTTTNMWKGIGLTLTASSGLSALAGDAEAAELFWGASQTLSKGTTAVSVFSDLRKNDKAGAFKTLALHLTLKRLNPSFNKSDYFSRSAFKLGIEGHKEFYNYFTKETNAKQSLEDFFKQLNIDYINMKSQLDKNKTDKDN